MSIFDKFDRAVDLEKIERQKKEAAEHGGGDFPKVPAGKYIAKIENMELGLTKKDNRPMFKVQMRLVEGCGNTEENFLSKFNKKKPCIFMNRVIFGTKNDGSMIASVETFLNKLDLDRTFVFAGYNDFANEIMSAAEECENLEFEVEYDDSKFNGISITGVFESSVPF